MNILVIDDHPNLVRVTTMALRTLGCRTFAAGTIAAATQLLGKEKIDGIFLDVNLGAESGWDFLSQLVTETARPPVIMFTAETKEGIDGEAILRGALGCMVKPFDIEDLTQQMKRLEQHRRDVVAEQPNFS